jgi:hypothetical protein
LISRYWRGCSFETKSALALLAAVLLSLAGFSAAAALTDQDSTAASEGEAEGVLVQTLTVERVVTLAGGVRTVVRPARVVRRVVRRVTGPARDAVTSTRLVTVTVTTREIDRKVVPIVRRDVVTVAGQARTIVETREGPTRTIIVRNERVQTVVRTVVEPVTTTQVVTQPPVTQTVRSTDTVTRTETVSLPVTVQVPVTVTLTVTKPRP